MLQDVSRDKRYVRKFDPKTGMMHVWARGTPVPVCCDQKNEKAMDWDEVFGGVRWLEHTFEAFRRRCSRCGIDRDFDEGYSCLPDQGGTDGKT